MEIKKAIHILDQHNKWRKDNNIPTLIKQVDSKELGIAIDKILHILNSPN